LHWVCSHSVHFLRQLSTRRRLCRGLPSADVFKQFPCMPRMRFFLLWRLHCGRCIVMHKLRGSASRKRNMCSDLPAIYSFRLRRVPTVRPAVRHGLSRKQRQLTVYQLFVQKCARWQQMHDHMSCWILLHGCRRRLSNLPDWLRLCNGRYERRVHRRHVSESSRSVVMCGLPSEQPVRC